MRWLVVIAVTLGAAEAHAWEERGHDLVARVAARIVAQRMPNTPLAKILVSKENMLGHLANVPDIVWRGGDKAVAAANAPTHFIDWDSIVQAPTMSSVPHDYASAMKLAKDHNLDLAKDVGTAPWRVQQLITLMQQAFAANDVDKALLYGGLAAHFVGDLSNPWHTTQDYDGWAMGEGGVHGYFEGELVTAQPLSFDAAILDQAIKKQPAKALVAKVGDDTLLIALAESVDAYSYLADVRALDTKYALVGKSTGAKSDKDRKPALRKAPDAVAQFFEPRLRERLATAADVLATLWMNAWEAAGKPDLTNYRSYAYPVAPEFVPPSYITP